MVLELASLNTNENMTLPLQKFKSNYILICISKQIAANETVACQTVVYLNKHNKQTDYVLI